MVIGKERTNWHGNHGSACTCAKCEAKRKMEMQFDERTKGRKIGRNEKCPCDSGQKYKKCHGR